MATFTKNFAFALFCYLHFVEVVIGGSQDARSLSSLLPLLHMNENDQKPLSWEFFVQYNSTNQYTNPNPVGQGQTEPETASRQNNPTNSPKLKFYGKKRRKRGTMIREFLYEHNKVRREFNEPSLAWDKKLARYAERYANERKKECDMIHSNGQYGESIYWGMHYDRHSAADAVLAWASEGKYYDVSTHTCTYNQKCGHYTQMIWRSSKRIGCARVKCDNGGVFIICVYDPPGNYHNEDPLNSVV